MRIVTSVTSSLLIMSNVLYWIDRTGESKYRLTDSTLWFELKRIGHIRSSENLRLFSDN